MKILISSLLYLIFITTSVTARDRYQERDDIPQTTRECRANLSSLGTLIRRHNPDEEHMSKLRKKARIISTYCQEERFARAHRLFREVKRSIQSVDNADTALRPNTQRKNKIKQCLNKLNRVGKKVVAASLEPREKRRMQRFGKNMHQNCRLQRFRRADKDHAAILRLLKRMAQTQEDQADGIKTARGCRLKVRKFSQRVNRKKRSRQVRTWMRKSLGEITELCKRRKFARAEQKYQAALTDFSQYLHEEDKPEPVIVASPRDLKNCRRSYSYIFKLINKKKISSRQRRKLLAKRKTLGHYCYEKDFSSAKKLFKELRSELSRFDNVRTVSNERKPVYPEIQQGNIKITAQNCTSERQTLERQADQMDLSPRNASGLKAGRKRMQRYCDRRNYRAATLWHSRVQKRMLQMRKDNRRYRDRISPTNNNDAHARNRPTRSRNDRHASSSNPEGLGAKQSCLQNQKILVRRVSNDAHSFRLRTKLRLKAALMRRACNRKRFDDANIIYENAIKALDQQ